jgi:hypothetical protein
MSQQSLAYIFVVTETIRDLKEVPAGHLYAQLMNHMSLSTFESIVALLVRAKLVTRKNHLLTWIGSKEIA